MRVVCVLLMAPALLAAQGTELDELRLFFTPKQRDMRVDRVATEQHPAPVRPRGWLRSSAGGVERMTDLSGQTAPALLVRPAE